LLYTDLSGAQIFLLSSSDGAPTCVAYLLFEAVNLETSKESPREIYLKPWDECVGIYRGLRTSGSRTAIVLSLANNQTLEILFPRASVEEFLGELHDDIIGRKIGIMKVNDGKNPILIRALVPAHGVDGPLLQGENR